MGASILPQRPPMPPASEQELMQRAAVLAGHTLAELANALEMPVPPDLQHNKGWAGQLLETCLGASAGSLSTPDFPELGIELKTLPVDSSGQPLESTYVCMVDLQPASGDWFSSSVWQKLRKVLWLPLVTSRDLAPGERRIGGALLWSPTTVQAAALRTDWEELMDLVSSGDFEQLSSRQGRYLQIRPKAANSRALTQAADGEGQPVLTLPRGFYLRAALTREILAAHYHL